MPKASERIADARERAMEIGLYLPLGAYSKVRDEITSLSRTRVRKTFEDLIDRGQGRLEPIERVVRRRSSDVRDAAESAAQDARKTAETTAKKTSKRASVAAAVMPKLPRVAVPKSASDLPIESYNSLTANEIIARLQGLTQTDLAIVYKYERAHEGRTTILENIESRIVTLPIPTYDALTVEELNDRLERLSEEDLKKLRRYEQDTKMRTTVIEKIDSLL